MQSPGQEVTQPPCLTAAPAVHRLKNLIAVGVGQVSYDAFPMTSRKSQDAHRRHSRVVHCVTQKPEDRHGVGPGCRRSNNCSQGRFNDLYIFEPFAILPRSPAKLTGLQIEHAVSDARSGIQRSHEKHEADIQCSQGIFSNVSILLGVQCPQEIVTRLENTLDALEYGAG